jgi:YfiH family protein
MPDTAGGTVADTGWDERAMGLDRVVAHVADHVTMVFALGPPRGAASDGRLSAMLENAAGDLTAVRSCRQVHGRSVHHIVGRSGGVLQVGDGDGMVTDSPGRGLLVWTADCVPVLLAGDGVVAAVHSGWRGCAADVVGAALEELHTRFGAAPQRLRAALGPSICGDCYEVGPEVVAALRALGAPDGRWLVDNHVDLRGFLRGRLEALGVRAENIESVGGCTVESPDLASYRRDGAAAGRQWSMVFLHR